jgi:hypothetical protein
VATSIARSGTAQAEPANDAGGAEVPVVVELFTSEGCSSCPAADAVLATLEREQPLLAKGARVVPLAFHVDYWDELGWPDPFASPAFTRRQRAYASAGDGRVYTPEAVVDGEAGFVGSDRALAEKTIERAAKHPKARVTVARAAGSFTVDVGALPGVRADDSAEAVLAVTQTHATVAVPRGENGGKSLEHTAIVRELRVLGPCPAAGAHFTFDAKAPDANTQVVVFIQEKRSRHILGASVSR